MSAGDRDTLTDVEREVISWWDDGTYGCHHTEDVCPTPDECRGKYGLVAAVEQIVSDAVAARVRAAQAQAWDRLCNYLDDHVDSDVRESVKRAARDSNPYRSEAREKLPRTED